MDKKPRMNISIVDENCINEMIVFRRQLEGSTDKRFSWADIVKILLNTRRNLIDISSNI